MNQDFLQICFDEMDSLDIRCCDNNDDSPLYCSNPECPNQPKLRMVIPLDIAKIKPEMYPDLFIKMIPTGWAELLMNYWEELQTVGDVLKNKVAKERQVLAPHPWNIYRAFQMTPWWNTKIIIIGQDPYETIEGSEPSATGCCFECAKGMPIRHSLMVLFWRLCSTVQGFQMPDSGDLSKWAYQGVLLMNAALTTNGGTPGAHLAIWEFFPKRVLQYISKKRKNLVFMLWGRKAQGYAKFIEKGHLILECSHPAARGRDNSFGSMNHFNEANEYLVKNGKAPVDWILHK